MSDAHLTDHEWKLKMAAEGRAFYLPGKTADQMKAEQSQKNDPVAGQEPRELPIALPEAVWMNLPDAVNEVNHMIRMAQGALDHLLGVMWQLPSADQGMVAIIELASRGLKHVSEHEGALLDDVEMVLRTALSGMLEEKRLRETEGKSL